MLYDPPSFVFNESRPVVPLYVDHPHWQSADGSLKLVENIPSTTRTLTGFYRVVLDDQNPYRIDVTNAIQELASLIETAEAWERSPESKKAHGHVATCIFEHEKEE